MLSSFISCTGRVYPAGIHMMPAEIKRHQAYAKHSDWDSLCVDK